jgi:hypothetical protein
VAAWCAGAVVCGGAGQGGSRSDADLRPGGGRSVLEAPDDELEGAVHGAVCGVERCERLVRVRLARRERQRAPSGPGALHLRRPPGRVHEDPVARQQLHVSRPDVLELRTPANRRQPAPARAARRGAGARAPRSRTTTSGSPGGAPCSGFERRSAARAPESLAGSPAREGILSAAAGGTAARRAWIPLDVMEEYAGTSSAGSQGGSPAFCRTISG